MEPTANIPEEDKNISELLTIAPKEEQTEISVSNAMEVSERLANEQEIEYTRRLATERESRMENGITTGRLKSDFKEEGTGRLDIATSLHAVAFRDFSTTPGFSHRCRSDAITNEDLRYHESLKHSNKKVDAFVILCFCSDEFYLDTFPREPSCHFSIGQF